MGLININKTLNGVQRLGGGCFGLGFGGFGFGVFLNSHSIGNKEKFRES